MEQKKRLMIIDSNSLIHRAFHALPPLTTKKGDQVGAVYGFLLAFFKAINDFKPDFIVATFDVPSPTFRHKQFDFYKANRAKTPNELVHQIPLVKEVLDRFCIPFFGKEGFEADDLIGTISRIAPKSQISPKLEVIILSGDADLLQLVNDQVKVYNLKRGVKNIVLYDIEKVREKYKGLFPEQLNDYKGLRGDPSDNVPGVPGIGEKTAIDLISKFGNLENIYEEIEKNTEKSKEIKQRIKEKLIENKNTAFISKKITKIKQDVPIEFNLQECIFGDYEKEDVIKKLKELEFSSLIDKIPVLEDLKED